MKSSKFQFKLISLFTGAGGLDLGFELQGFNLIEGIEIDQHCLDTLKYNRPNWNIKKEDARNYNPQIFRDKIDVLTAGFPCQGFSLGGKRDINDSRNVLYREVIRIAKSIRPKVIILENVLNLRTMYFPGSNKTVADEIANEIGKTGYTVYYETFRVSQYGVPQTRRRFVFVCFLGLPPKGYHLPMPGDETPIRKYLYKLGQNTKIKLPNHNPKWGFKSRVHIETNEKYPEDEVAVPVRFSRTASDGYPIRSFDEPFPAIDTATVWGWARGNVKANRYPKDRKNGKYIRNPNANVTLWRISASNLRTFTHREYARLQTFPDSWKFLGNNKRDIHKQIGNAVPVDFAKHLARNIKNALKAKISNQPFKDLTFSGNQFKLPI